MLGEWLCVGTLNSWVGRQWVKGWHDVGVVDTHGDQQAIDLNKFIARRGYNQGGTAGGTFQSDAQLA